MIKNFNKIGDIKSLIIFNYYKFISNFNKYKFRSSRGLGDLFMDVLFINWLSNRSKKKIYLFCRSEHIHLISELLNDSIIVKRVSLLNYFNSWDLWRNRNAQERIYRLNKSLSARYIGFFNSIINKWYLLDEELKSISQIIPSNISKNSKININNNNSTNNKTNILIINSYPLSGQCHNEIINILDNLIYILISQGHEVRYTRKIDSFNLNNELYKISIKEIKNLIISSETVLGVATGPFWFSYLNNNINNRIGITDHDIVNLSKNDKSLSSYSFMNWYSSNIFNQKIIKLDDILLDMRKYYK